MDPNAPWMPLTAAGRGSHKAWQGRVPRRPCRCGPVDQGASVEEQAASWIHLIHTLNPHLESYIQIRCHACLQINSTTIPPFYLPPFTITGGPVGGEALPAGPGLKGCIQGGPRGGGRCSARASGEVGQGEVTPYCMTKPEPMVPERYICV